MVLRAFPEPRTMSGFRTGWWTKKTFLTPGAERLAGEGEGRKQCWWMCNYEHWDKCFGRQGWSPLQSREQRTGWGGGQWCVWGERKSSLRKGCLSWDLKHQVELKLTKELGSEGGGGHWHPEKTPRKGGPPYPHHAQPLEGPGGAAPS